MTARVIVTRAVGVSKSSTILILALVVCLALEATGVSLGSGGISMLALGAILLLGLPHGTFDLALLRRRYGASVRVTALGLALYLGGATLTLALWHLSPLVALAGFFFVAIIHFGEDWEEVEQPFLAHGTALALLAAPALLHRATLDPLLSAITGDARAPVIADILVLAAPVAIATALVCFATLWAKGARSDALTGVAALAGMLLLPPLVGFALFFCLLHSPRHFSANRDASDCGASGAWVTIVVPLTALAGVGAAILYVFAPPTELPLRLASACFMTLSVLTIPHLTVPALMQRLLGRSHR